MRSAQGNGEPPHGGDSDGAQRSDYCRDSRVARVIGETAPLLLTSLSNVSLRFNPVDGPIASLPTYIFGYLQIGTEYAIARAWSGSLVLLAIVLVLFTIARRIGGKDKR